MSSAPLTTEQRERIARNKEAALARRASLQAHGAKGPAAEAGTPSSTGDDTWLDVDACWRVPSTTAVKTSDVVDPARVRVLNDRPVKTSVQGGRFVLWWVQSDVREAANHALEFSIAAANELQVPVLACYGLWERFPGANARSFSFLVSI